MITKSTPTQNCLRRLHEITLNDGTFTEAEQRARVGKLVQPGVHLLVTAMLRSQGMAISLEAEQAASRALRIMSAARERALVEIPHILKEDIAWPQPLLTLTPEAAQEVRLQQPWNFDEVLAIVAEHASRDQKVAAQTLAA